MEIRFNTTSTSNCLKECVQTNNPNAVQQYFVVSNAISALFGSVSEPGIVAHAETKAITSVSAIAPIGSAPANSTQAEMQAAGLMAFINRLMSQFDGSPEAKKLLEWARNKLKELSSSIPNNSSLHILIEAITYCDEPGRGPNRIFNGDVKKNWNKFWNEGGDFAPGGSPTNAAMKTILSSMENWMKASDSLKNPDNDTLFGIIMLFNDLGQEPGISKNVFDIAEQFFQFDKGPEGSGAFEYARFVAYYFWNEAHTGKLPLNTSQWFCQHMFTADPKTAEYTKSFADTLNAYMTDLKPNADWPFTPIQFILDMAKATWLSFLNYKN